jgi:hypothetical protein
MYSQQKQRSLRVSLLLCIRADHNRSHGHWFPYYAVLLCQQLFPQWETVIILPYIYFPHSLAEGLFSTRQSHEREGLGSDNTVQIKEL